jgi:phospholipid-translocating ATPase
MILSILLFESEFVHIVSISFTALIFNELLMVALEIQTWHVYMIVAEVVTLGIYVAAMGVLKGDFDMGFVGSWRFVWKVSLIVVVSGGPLGIGKWVRMKLSPPSYMKLEG